MYTVYGKSYDDWEASVIGEKLHISVCKVAYGESLEVVITIHGYLGPVPFIYAAKSHTYPLNASEVSE